MHSLLLLSPFSVKMGQILGPIWGQFQISCKNTSEVVLRGVHGQGIMRRNWPIIPRPQREVSTVLATTSLAKMRTAVLASAQPPA